MLQKPETKRLPDGQLCSYACVTLHVQLSGVIIIILIVIGQADGESHQIIP